MTQIECVIDCKNSLGEGPVWCPIEKALYWVDIKGMSISRHDFATGETKVWPVNEQPGSLALRKDGGLVVAFYGGFRLFDLETGAIETIHEIESDTPQSRMNDGRCDRQGRFWAGSMDDEMVEPLGSLYRLDPDMSCHKMDTGIICSNSLAFSPDGRTMYYADLGIEQVWAYDLDTDSGDVTNKRPFFSTKDMQGAPDGSAVDEDGCLWNAMWGGWCLARWTPDGRLDRKIELPFAQVTCPMFGGDNLDVIYVTGARFGLSDEQLASQPQAGGVFAVHAGVKGLPEPRFAG